MLLTIILKWESKSEPYESLNFRRGAKKWIWFTTVSNVKIRDFHIGTLEWKE